jgi:pyridoxal phosphate enzyme (YggS family)
LIFENIEKSARKVNKKNSDITLVAVSKRFNEDYIKTAYLSGLKIFGENRVQEAVKKTDFFKNYDDLDFHIIGHLQLNKVKYLKDKFSLIHSIDREELVHEFDKRITHIQDVLIQVNIADESQKSGVKLDKLDILIEKVINSKTLRLRGLMLIPPNYDNIDDTRKIFNKMYEVYVRTKIKLEISDKCSFDYLSMGMSADYMIAIEEGSNMIRVGSAIFGQRLN